MDTNHMNLNKTRYEKYTGRESRVSLPADVEGESLAVIGSKAFLSCKTVEQLVLPAGIEAVEDWGFAHMKNLEEIVLPARQIRFGRQVFLGCESLNRVVLYSVKKSKGNAEIHILGELAGLDKLRASMFRFFPQESLEQLEDFTHEAGQRQWLAKYDAALEIFLRKPDDVGFEPAFIGWFDVEDVDDQKQGYILNRRKDKIGLVLQRLTCGEEPEELLRDYLYGVVLKYSEHVKELLMEHPEYGRDIRYYKIWKQSGGLERSEAEYLLINLPWEEPEIRAYLMEQLTSQEDFFSLLEL